MSDESAKGLTKEEMETTAVKLGNALSCLMPANTGFILCIVGPTGTSTSTNILEPVAGILRKIGDDLAEQAAANAAVAAAAAAASQEPTNVGN